MVLLGSTVPDLALAALEVVVFRGELMVGTCCCCCVEGVVCLGLKT